jgi:hypothetical protein
MLTQPLELADQRSSLCSEPSKPAFTDILDDSLWRYGKLLKPEFTAIRSRFPRSLISA